MAKNTDETVDAPAAVAAQPPVEPVETRTPRRRGLLLGGVIAGGVLATALVFGGGVLLGATLHGHEPRMDVAQGQLPGALQAPGGQQPGAQQQGGQQGGPQNGGPQRGNQQQGGQQAPQGVLPPQQGDTDTDSDTDSDDDN